MAQTLSRGPDEIARGGDQLVIYVQVDGELDATYAGRERRIRPGDVAIIDYSREIVSVSTDFAIMYLMVARDRVPPLFSRRRCTAPSFRPRAARRAFFIEPWRRCSRRRMR